MNILFKELEKLLAEYADKKIIIYGAGAIGRILKSAFDSYKKEVAYFVDGDDGKQGKRIWDCEVKSPYDLLYENLDEIIVVLGLSAQDEASEVLESLGLQENVNYHRLNKIETEKTADVFDPHLGFSRVDDIEGFRIFGSKDAELVILAMGGSTTDYSMSNINSWPYYLQQEMENEGISCQVINGGIGGYYSSQEMLKLVRDGLMLNPDIVISYSGVNDAHGLFCDIDTPMIANYLKKTLNDLPMKNKKIGYGFKKDISRSENWVRNMRIMHAVSTEFDAQFYSFLQPHIWSGKYNATELELALSNGMLPQERVYMEEFYDGVQNGIKEYSYIYDFTDIFDGMSDLFYDFVHCSEEGNRIIARKIYEVIKEGRVG